MSALTKKGKPRQRLPKGAPIGERIKFWTVISEGCWCWRGVIDRWGYGRITIGGRVGFAHRMSYEAFVGPIPDGLQIDHLCRNRACCNPEHLEPVTGLVNTRRSRAALKRERAAVS
jgi:hypothetical protein